MKIPEIITIENSILINTAKQLPAKGLLKISNNRLLYLDLDDDYIHKLYTLLKLNKPNAIKPNYFTKNAAGAHISVVYPEESYVLDENDLNKQHHFAIKSLIAARINEKIYYALRIESLSLKKIRDKYHLPKLLPFKGYGIFFHITIGYELVTY